MVVLFVCMKAMPQWGSLLLPAEIPVGTGHCFDMDKQ